MATAVGNLSETTVRNMKVAWAIWTEVGDLDRYPTVEEAGVVAKLASEVNGILFHVTMTELARRMADNYFYPFEDHVAQQRAYMFEPGSWEALSYVDKVAVVDRLISLPPEVRFGLESGDGNHTKDGFDQRAANYQAMGLERQATIASLVNRWSKR
jgi:hypothetical protein